jgi:DNA polymerase
MKVAEFPLPVVVLDFESFFDTEFTLRKMSTIEYITDDRFELLGLSMKVGEEGATSFFKGEEGVARGIKWLQHHYGENLERCTVVAHNARYDCAILKWIFNISPKYIIDTLGLARHWNARARNRVEDVAKREGLQEKGDTSEFKEWTTRNRYKKRGGRGKQRLMPVKLPIMTPEKWDALADYANNDVELEWEIFKRFMPRLSNPRVELDVQNHTLHLYLDPAFEVDEKQANPLIDDMEAEIDRVMDEVGHTRKEISGELSFEALMAEQLEFGNDNIQRYMKPAKNKRGQKLANAKDDPQRELLEEHEFKGVRELMAAKAALSSWPNHIKRIRNIIAQCKAAGGLLPVPLSYCGAHTGRFSGGEKINLQNLGSRGHELVNRIRTLLIAPADWELVIADASQIEARVLAWIAGQEDLVAKFAAGDEVYCDFASRVLGRPIRKARESDPPEVAKRLTWIRNSIGKVGILGCGYGMGGKKAVGYSGGALDLQQATQVVDTYRADHPKITAFWREVERKFIITAKYGTPCTMARGLSFRGTDEVDVIITLPSGRELKYHDVKIRKGKYGRDQASVRNPKNKKWMHIWGGTLTENIVQAISRDLLWSAISRVIKAGHRVIHHVHDELIALVQKGMGSKVLETCLAALRHVPRWANGCPLDAEGLVTCRYGSH